MTYKDFVQATICNLSQPVFEKLKQLLLGEYISFSIIDHILNQLSDLLTILPTAGHSLTSIICGAVRLNSISKLDYISS